MSSMFELPEDIQEIQTLARDFARSEVLPGAQARDKEHAFPSEIVQKLGEMGFMGMFVPEVYGGAGLSTLAYVVALEEICYADASVGVTMSVNNSLASWPILAFGTGCRERCRRTADEGDPDGRWLASRRQQNLDHERPQGADLCRLRERGPGGARQGGLRLHPGEPLGGVRGREARGEARHHLELYLGAHLRRP